MCDLFGQVVREVSKNLSYSYDEEEENSARFYLDQVYRLPKDAMDIFKEYNKE